MEAVEEAAARSAAPVGAGLPARTRLIVSWKRLGRVLRAEAAAPRRRARARRGAGAGPRRPRSGSRLGDVVEVAGEEAHLVAGAVDLDAGAVELPLHRRQAELGDGLGHAGRRSRPAWAAPAACTWRPTSSRPPAPGQGDRAVAPRSPESMQARRTAAAGTPAALATASVISPVERALAQLAAEQPPEELAFGGRGPAQQSAEQAARGPRPRAGPGRPRWRRWPGRSRRRSGWARCRRPREARPEGGPADADPALAGLAGEEADDRLDLVGLRAAPTTPTGGRSSPDGRRWSAPPRRRPPRRRTASPCAQRPPSFRLAWHP